MNFSDHSQFRPPQTPYNGGGSDVVNCWPPAFSMNNDDQHSQVSQVEQQPFKRARNSEERQSNPMPYPPMNYRVQQPSAPVNKGASNIFYKTRLCVNFKSGMCRNGENCNYAHGIEDIRHPPPNWQELVSIRDEDRPLSGNWDDDQKIIHRMKLCKKFYNGEECPYGDRCNFLHEDPSKFRDDSGRFRENTAISIGITGAPVAHGSGSNPPEENRLVNAGMDASQGNVKPVYWKTKLCNKWETTGKCPFSEKCHFAHGLTELQVPGGRTVEAEFLNTPPLPIPQVVAAVNSSATAIAALPALNNDGGQRKKGMLKWKGSKKINRIYADWLDDVPLVHQHNLVES